MSNISKNYSLCLYKHKLKDKCPFVYAGNKCIKTKKTERVFKSGWTEEDKYIFCPVEKDYKLRREAEVKENQGRLF